MKIQFYFAKSLIIILLFSIRAQAQVPAEIIQKYPVSALIRLQYVVDRVNLPIEMQDELARYYTTQNEMAELKRKQGATLQEISKYISFDLAPLSKMLTPIQFIEFSTSGANPSELAKAFKYRKELGLTAVQVDALVPLISKLKNNDPDGVDLSKRLQYEQLKGVLNKDQFQNYFTLISQDTSLKIALSNWRQLKKYKQVNNTDSATVTDMVYHFTLNKISNIERVNYYRPNSSDSIGRYYELYKPSILWKLDANRNTLPWWMWDWVGRLIIHRKELKLTDSQVDSLLTNDINLEKKRWEKPVRYANEFVNNWPETLAFVTRILTDEQYTKFLEIRNINHSVYNADLDWVQLKEKGFIPPNADSKALLQETQEYELKLLAANEKYYNDRSQKNLFAKQTIENNKPNLLKKLEVIKNQLEAEARTKATLAW